MKEDELVLVNWAPLSRNKSDIVQLLVSYLLFICFTEDTVITR